MRIEPVTDVVFVGLVIRFTRNMLLCRAAWGPPGEPLYDASYSGIPAPKFQDWASWAPQSQKRALVLSLIHRCVQFANSSSGLEDSATEVFVFFVEGCICFLVILCVLACTASAVAIAMLSRATLFGAPSRKL